MQELEAVKRNIALLLGSAVHMEGIASYSQAYDDIMVAVLRLNREKNPKARRATLHDIRQYIESVPPLQDYAQEAYRSIDALDKKLLTLV